MKQIKILILALVLGCSLTSCYIFNALFSGSDAKSWDWSMYGPMEEARLLLDTATKRDFLIFPLSNRATPKHLAYFKKYLDLKKAQGYVVFYETVDLCGRGENLTDQEIDTLRRKYRRVVGVDLNRKAISPDKSISVEHCRQAYNLRGWVDSMGLTTDRDFHLDMSLAQIVAHYEQNYKPIELTHRDFEVALDDASYSPSDTVAHAKYYMVWGPRARYIIDRAMNEKNVVVVCSKDLMGYMLRPLFDKGYRSRYGFGANEDFKKLSSPVN